MKTILLGGAAFSLLTVSAFGADLGTAPPVKSAAGTSSAFCVDELLRRRARRWELGQRGHD